MPSRIDLNRATQEELSSIPSIGPELACEIVRRREQRGRIESIDELDTLSQIDGTRMQYLRANTVAGRGPAEDQPPRGESQRGGPQAARSPSGKRQRQRGPVNLNRASRDELEHIPGIDGMLAEKIIEYRERHGGFRNLDQVQQVEGIDGQRVRLVREHATV